MNDFMALEISGAGMRVQRERMRVVAENLANQHVTGPNGPYQRKQVVMESVPAAGFDAALSDQMQAATEPARSVAVTSIQTDQSEPQRVYDPSHPHADADGYVAYPNVSVFREMTDMVESSRMYEANLTASKVTRDMLTAALDLLRK